MINETEFVTAIDMIADKIGVAAVEIFNIFTHAQATLGIISLIGTVVVVIATYITFRKLFRWMSGCNTYSEAKANEKDSYDDEVDSALGVSIVVSLVLALIYLCIVGMIGNDVIRILCPEYSAIKEIISIIK